jgi:hypothetical protein
MLACRRPSCQSGNERELYMGTIIEFPADAALRRPGSTMVGTPFGTVLILPVVRIERTPDETSGGSGPEEGTAPRRRRRRRT